MEHRVGAEEPVGLLHAVKGACENVKKLKVKQIFIVKMMLLYAYKYEAVENRKLALLALQKQLRGNTDTYIEAFHQ